jgi:hypothetical protein
MTSRDFCYWLQGFLEISGDIGSEIKLNSKQIDTIKNHLNLVFKHEIDPSFGEDQDELNQIHSPWTRPEPGTTIVRC